jgi:hypothetical protein
MVVSPEYSLQTQAKIPLALGSLHNFIRISDPGDDARDDEDYCDDEDQTSFSQPDINSEHLGQHISQAEKDRASDVRDQIAIAMWEDYQNLLVEQEELL